LIDPPSRQRSSYASMGEAGEWQSQSAIVMDVGSYEIKAGFGGDEAPSHVFGSRIGKPKMPFARSSKEEETTYIGDFGGGDGGGASKGPTLDPVSRMGVLKVTYPIERGHVTNWDMMEKLCHYMFFEKFKMDPSERAVFTTEHALSADIDKEKMTKLMFEKFNVPGYFMELGGVVALASNGKTTGCVVDIGHGVTETVPVYEGYVLHHAARRWNLAGKDLSEYMIKCLKRKGPYTFTTSAEHQIVNDMKAQIGYVAEDYAAEMKKSRTSKDDTAKEFELPDGTTIEVNAPRFQCAEPLFQPKLVGLEHDGLTRMIVDTIKDCEVPLRKELFDKITLVGGTTMFGHFRERLDKELRSVLPKATNFKVAAAAERKYSVWIGGSVLSNLNHFASLWITKQDYEEHGVEIIHKRCGYN